jgi:TIR domain
MTYDVFLSYSRADEAFVGRLNEFLNDAGLKTWFDKSNLHPGQRWEEVIEDEIPRSRTFLTCLSKAGLDRRGHFMVEQHLATQAALRIPPGELFIIPVLLGDCEIPRSFRQYHIVNLIEPGAIETLLLSFSDALGHEVVAATEAVEALRQALIAHLGVEAASNEEYAERFLQTEELSFQDSVGLIERIANSWDPNRLALLLRLRGTPFLSYAEQGALDHVIENVKHGRPTQGLQEEISTAEKARISTMGIPGNPMATMILQVNKYARYVARKNTAAYKIAEAKIHEMLPEALDSFDEQRASQFRESGVESV